MNKHGKTIFWIMLISLITKGIGFLRELVLAYYYGTTSVTDAYLMAVYIPSVFWGWLTTISICYMPILAETKEREGDFEADKYTSLLLLTSVFISLVCVLLGLLFSKQIVNTTVRGFSVQAKQLTENFYKITIWLIVLNTPIQILISYLNYKEKQVAAIVSTLFLSSTQMLFIVLGGQFQISVFLPVGILFSYILQMLTLVISCKMTSMNFRVDMGNFDRVKMTFVLTVPAFITSLSSEINSFVDKVLASSLPIGSVSSLNYAHIIHDFMNIVFSSSITYIVFPQIARYVSLKQDKGVKRIVQRGIIYIFILFIPISTGAILLSKQIVTLVFKRGSFDVLAVEKTYRNFIAYSVGLTAIVLNGFLGKVFIAIKNTKVNMQMGLITIASNIVLNLLLVHILGTIGLALATSLSALIVLPLYMIKIKKFFRGISFKTLVMSLIKIIVAASIMGMIICLLKQLLLSGEEGKIILLCKMLLIVSIGCIVYGFSAYLLQIEGFREIYLYFVNQIRLIPKTGDRY